MPTAAKLVAALCLAALALLTSEFIKTLMPASTAFGIFTYVNVGLGFIVGWLVIGNRAGRGYPAAVANGLTGVVALVFWAVFIQAANEMIRLAMRHRYDGPFEALTAIFEEMVNFGEILVDPGVISILLFGSLISGYLAEFAANRWR